MKKRFHPFAIIAVLAAVGILAACSRSDDQRSGAEANGAGDEGAAEKVEELVVYSGRAESLVGPILERFEQQHGVTLAVRYGDTPALAALILEEGERSPAAAFLAQDVGAVGALGERGMLAKLPADVLARVPSHYRDPGGAWVGVTGRARTLVYNPAKVSEDELPDSILELTDPKWKGRVGWAPQNGSFQVFVTGLRLLVGDEKAEQWLRDMQANDPREYPKNSPIVQAVAAGEVDVGLVNHYYLLQFQRDDPAFAARQHFTGPKDAGTLVNLSAFAVLDSASDAEARAAAELARFLLSDEVQAAFAAETFEYPLVEGAPGPAGLAPLATIEPPPLDLGDLHDLQGTLALLRKTGVLP